MWPTKIGEFSLLWQCIYLHLGFEPHSYTYISQNNVYIKNQKLACIEIFTECWKYLPILMFILFLVTEMWKFVFSCTHFKHSVVNIPPITKITTFRYIEVEEEINMMEIVETRSYEISIKRYVINDHILIMYNLLKHDS